MHDPFSWSFSLGQMFGILVRVHVLMPLLMTGLVLRETFRDNVISGTWIDSLWLMSLLFLVVLLHELGHCFMARSVNGDAREILMWPLGGLASVDLPHNPRAHFLTAFGGPLVNIVLCLATALALGYAFDVHWQPPWNPLWYPYRVSADGAIKLLTWAGKEDPTTSLAVCILARLFWLSWITLLLNVVLIGFPLDGGRMFQAALWPYFGYRQAMFYAIYTGFFVMFVVVIASIAFQEPVTLGLGLFMYVSCKQEWLILEGGGEESLFGYDFSQGYTSLEKDAPPAPRKKQLNFFQRWMQRRKQLKLQLEQERQEADEKRMDELLQKIAQYGKESLTDEENRFLKRVSDRYRNRP